MTNPSTIRAFAIARAGGLVWSLAFLACGPGATTGGDPDLAAGGSADLTMVGGSPDLTVVPIPDLTMGCMDDSTCRGATPRCDTKTGKCVPCLPANDNCGDGKYCVDLNGTYSCNPGCANDAMCKAGDGGGAGALACCKNMCIDTASDNMNCGTCGNACANGSVCCSGKCVDTATDLKNCGACGSACAGANATIACETAKCVLKSCAAGFADCDKIGDNGCEVNTDTDAMNCLGCGMTCGVANGRAGCNKGCTIDACNSGFADCDKQLANGCEVNTDVETANCGGCGMACPAAPNANSACSAGKCVISACNGTFLDCDNSPANGCEVNGSTDAKNCGACGGVCPAVTNGVAGCAGGTCGIAFCTGAYADCNMNAGDGCEVDTSNTVGNCGACGKVCPAPPNATAGCAAGTCGVGMCAFGYLDCNKDPNDGCEVTGTNDVKNCGGCGKVCPGGMNSSPVCTNGICSTIPCMAPFQECNGNPADGCEANTATDINNCAACGTVCPAVANGTIGCKAGVCGIGVCNAPFKNCDNNAGTGCETDSNIDVNNCGACGTKCAAANGTAGCGNGVCKIAGCNNGYGDCKNGYADGCETATSADINNCGKCALKCLVANGTPSCSNGACDIASCNAGFSNCKNGYADGCETSTNTDKLNCGACNKVCAAVANGTPGCAAGVCNIASCTAPYFNCDNNVANGCEINGSNDPKNCGGCGVVCPNGVCYNGNCKEAVLIVGAPATATWNNDVQSKLVSTGVFRAVDIINGSTTTPTVAQLQKYDAVLVYSDVGFASAGTLGDNLATYWDGGGRVVVATFGNASVPVGGRWASDNYKLIATGGQGGGNEVAALQIVEPLNPLAAGVTTLTSTAGFRSSGAAINGGVVVIKWGSGAPLVVRGVKNGRALAELNFYPPSVAVRADFWAGHGARLMANALQYRGYCHAIVGKNGGTCASGKVDWCDPAAPISPTSATQAKAACDACYGISCFLETDDCAGNGYGPKPLGMYTCGDAYYGYAAGCSGAAGRIWSICSSGTTYGRWAP